MSETARCIENAFDTDVIVVNAGLAGRALECALRHHGIDRSLLNGEASGCRADRRLWAKRHSLHGKRAEQLCTGGARVAVAGQGMARFPFFSRQRFR